MVAPANAIVLLRDKSIAGSTDRKCPWYGTDYSNEAFSAQQNKRSQELYTEALRLAVTKNVVECPPFTAILYCNRSATYQKDLDFTSALADCARSCSLDPHYVKAFSRAANICESVQVSALLLGKKRMMFA